MEPTFRDTASQVTKLGITNTLVALLNVLTSVIFVRSLSVSSYGQALTLIALIVFLSSWTGLGAEAFIVSDAARELRLNRMVRARTFIQGLVLIKSLGILLLSVGFISAWTLDVPLSLATKSVTVILLVIWANEVRSVAQLITAAHSDFTKLSYLTLASSVLRLCGALILLIWPMGTVGYYLSVYGLANLLPSSVLLWIYRHTVLITSPRMAGYSIKAFCSLVRSHGKWGIILRVSKRALDPIPILILSYFFGSAVVAVYNVAAKFITLLQTPLTAAETVLTSMLARAIQTQAELSLLVTKFLLIASLMAASMGALVASWIITALYSSKYAPASSVALILLPTVVGRALRSYQRPMLQALRRQDLIVQTYLVSNAVTFLLTVILTPLFGINGFAAAQVCGAYVLFSIRELQLRKLGVGLRFKALFRISKTEQQAVRSFSYSLLKRLTSAWPQ